MQKICRLGASLFTLALLCGPTWVLGQTRTQPMQFDIAAQPVGRALNEFGKQAGLHVVVDSDLASGMRSPGVRGEYLPDVALGQLLGDTGLRFRFVDDSTVAVLGPEAKPSAAVSPTGAMRVVRADDDKSMQKVAAGDGETQDKRVELEEIVVTANKRQQNLQDAPLSLSALSAKEIERKGLVGMADYLRTTPGVSHLDLGSGRNATVIRGVSINPQSEGNSVGQTVGMYFGEVPLSTLRWFAADIKLVDIERIEVLRGPQGTLYGAGSLSGAVRTIPVAPNLQELEGQIEAGYSMTSSGGGGNEELKAVANFPLIEDKLALRFVGYRFENSGYIDNVAASDPAFVARAATYGAANLAVNRDDIGSSIYQGGRVQILWQPTENLRATLMYLAQDLDQKGLPEVQLSRGVFEQARLQLGDAIGGGSESLSDDTRIANLVLEYDLPWGTISSSSSHSSQEFERRYHIGSSVPNPLPMPQVFTPDADGFSEEIRVVSRLSGPVQFVAGFYYEDVESNAEVHNYFAGAPVLNPYAAYPVIGELFEDIKLRQSTVFGEVSYTFADRLTLTGGVRRFDYTRDTTTRLSGPLFGGASSSHLKSDEQNESYKVNLAYRANESALLYAQWSQGFRFGRPQAPKPNTCDLNGDGFIDGLNGVSLSAPDINSDYLDSYELGGKFDMLANRLIVNAAVYEIKWTGLPISVIPPCGNPVVLNAGRANSRGAEVESAFYLTEKLRINLGGSYVRAQLDADAPGIGAAAGDRLPGSPKYQYNAGFEYSFGIAAIPLFVRGDYAVVGGYYNNVKQAGAEAGDYGQLNLKIGATIKQIDVSLFANNLTNADSLTWVESTFSDGRAYRLRPRTIGLSASVRF